MVEVKSTVTKQGINDYGWVFINRKENISCLSELGFRMADVRDVILELSVLNYSCGPIRDRNMPGEFWVFGKMISGREIYIKLKLATIDILRIVRIVSFHSAKEIMYYPFIYEKGGDNEREYPNKR